MKLDTDILNVFNRDWALLTAGDKSGFNTMTIGWGGLGTLWSKPVATVYVKPTRYTHKFMENSDYFTVSFYEKQYRKALGVLGTLSGRDCDKVAQAGLHPEYYENCVTFQEAEITLVCRKIYARQLDIAAIPQDAIDRYYRDEPAHTMFVGEVVKIADNRRK